jgi:hypothetical protein
MLTPFFYSNRYYHILSIVVCLDHKVGTTIAQRRVDHKPKTYFDARAVSGASDGRRAGDSAGNGCFGSCLTCIGSLLDGGDQTRQVGSDWLSIAPGMARLMCGQAGGVNAGKGERIRAGAGRNAMLYPPSRNISYTYPMTRHPRYSTFSIVPFSLSSILHQCSMFCIAFTPM